MINTIERYFGIDVNTLFTYLLLFYAVCLVIWVFYKVYKANRKKRLLFSSLVIIAILSSAIPIFVTITTSPTLASNYENLETYYTERDDDGELFLSQYTCTLTNLDDNDEEWVVRDFGAGAWDSDFVHEFEWRFTDTNGIIATITPWLMSNTLGASTEDYIDHIYDGIFIKINIDDDTPANCRAQLYQSVGGSSSSYVYGTAGYYSPNTTYYVRMVRTDEGGSFSCGILDYYAYTGSLDGVLVEHLQLSLGEQNDYEYVYPLVNLRFDGVGVADIDGFTRNFEYYGVASELSTSEATLVTEVTARLNATVTDTGTANPTVTFYWGDNDGGTTPGSWDNSSEADSPAQPMGAGAAYEDITGLTAGTVYYFNAVADNSYGTDWGTTYSFRTDGAPIITSSSATLITNTSVRLNGEVTDDGGDPSNVTVAFFWGDNNAGEVEGSWDYQNVTPTSPSQPQGEVTCYLDNSTAISPLTTYYYILKGTNVFDSDYSTVQSFRSCGDPTITTSAATSVGLTTARLNGNVTDNGGAVLNSVPQASNDVDVTFYWGLTNGGTNPSSWTFNSEADSPAQPQDTGVCYYDATELLVDKLYYFTTYAESTYGSDWGSVLTLTTLYSYTPPPENEGEVTLPSDSHDMAGETGQPDMTGSQGDLSSNPFYPLVSFINAQSNIPINIIWIFGAMILVILAMLGVAKVMPNHMFFMLSAGFIVLVFLTVGVAIFPWWVMYVYLVFAIVMMLYERVPSI